MLNEILPNSQYVFTQCSHYAFTSNKGPQKQIIGSLIISFLLLLFKSSTTKLLHYQIVSIPNEK